MTPADAALAEAARQWTDLRRTPGLALAGAVAAARAGAPSRERGDAAVSALAGAGRFDLADPCWRSSFRALLS